MTFSAVNPAKVALMGAGSIARRYVEGLSRFPQLSLVGVVDVVRPLAVALADEAGIRAYESLEDLLSDDSIDIVVNITPPNAHAETTLQILAAGKHVYVEKPIAATLEDSRTMIQAARAAELLLGSAPDTFLGSAAQTARAAMDAEIIGEPIGAAAFIVHSRAETWHPNPTFLFQPGGGPTLDLGPYYITALVNLLGPVDSVSGFTRVGSPLRTVTSEGRTVDSITVTTPTHATASLRFTSGALCTVMMSFDVWDANVPKIEIYGSKGTLSLPDPNEFDGDVAYRLHTDSSWTVLPPVSESHGRTGDPVQFLRGYGVADLADAVSNGPHRASADLAQHVLEVLEAIQTSSDTKKIVSIFTQPSRPAVAAKGSADH